MSTQTYVIYDKYNGHIVCDIKDNYRIFDNAVKAEQYIRDKNCLLYTSDAADEL